MKKVLQTLLAYAVIMTASISGAFAGSLFLGDGAEIPYCQGDSCGLKKGTELVKDGVNDVKTEGKFSEYIQEVVIYLLGWLTLIAVIYIIYAGFKILVSNGDEETLKKSKTTILYVVIGIVVIWAAYTIAKFAIGIGDLGT